MVVTLMIPLRQIYHLEDFITLRHLDNMAKVMLATGWMLTYGYISEVFFAYYSGNLFERAISFNRALGPHAWSYWLLLCCNGLVPQLLWSRSVRTNIPALFIISIFVNVGMWLERYVIIVLSLQRDYLPSAWREYYPTIWDYIHLVGSVGLFLTLLLLFIRILPVISIFELRELVHTTGKEA
jgi:molybdopterin-containing oxidoreductase family membrane subunit